MARNVAPTKEQLLGYLKDAFGWDVSWEAAQAMAWRTKQVDREPICWAFPTRELMYGEFFRSFATNLLKWIHPLDMVQCSSGSGIAHARQQLVDWFLEKTDCDWLLFVDDDVCYRGKADPIRLLLSAAYANDAKVVSGIYTQRIPPYKPHAYTWEVEPTTGNYGYAAIENIDRIVVDIDAAGGGFLFIHRDVFNAIERPFFATHLVPGSNDNKGEDFFFCEKARAAGFRIVGDYRIELMHLQTSGVTVDHYAAKQVSARYPGEVQAMADRWKADRALVVGGLPTEDRLEELYRQGCADLQAHLGLDDRALAERLDGAVEKVARAWETFAPETPEAVERFYRVTDTYYGDLLEFNRTKVWAERVAPPLQLEAENVADLGGGIGTLAMLFARQGRRVSYIDLPGPTWDFARYRFEKHGHMAATDETQDGHPKGQVRMYPSLAGMRDLDLVTAVEVLEHIHPDRVEQAAREIAEALREGGQFYHASSFLDEDEEDATTHPMHYRTRRLWAEMFDKYGLRLIRGGLMGGLLVKATPAPAPEKEGALVGTGS